ncbi:hypothetical protein, partial [Amycolatopsis japonica]
MSLSEVVDGEITLSEVDSVRLSHQGRVVGAFFPLEQAEVAVVRSAFEAGAGVPGVYSLVGHGRGDGLWVRRRSDRQVVRLDEAGVWRLLNSLVLPGGAAWPVMPDVMIVSCWVDDSARGGFLGKVREVARKTGYRGELSGRKRRVRIRKGDPEIRELDGEPSGLVKGGVGYDENGVPYVDLAPPEWQIESTVQPTLFESNKAEQSVESQAEQVTVGPTSEGGVIQLTRLKAPVLKEDSGRGVEIGALTEWFAALSLRERQPIAQTALDELEDFLDVIARNMKILAEHGRETVDIRLSLTLAESVRAASAPVLRDWLAKTLWSGLERRGADPRGSGLRFDYSESREGANKPRAVKVTVHQSPNRSPLSYRAALRLELQVPWNDRLPGAHRRRLRWMVQGLVERVREAGHPGSKARLIADLRSKTHTMDVHTELVDREVIAAVRKALPGEPEAKIAKFIRDHVAFFRRRRPRQESELFLDIEGPPHPLDSVQVEPDLPLSWGEQITAAPHQNQLYRAAAKRRAAGPPQETEAPRQGTVSTFGEARRSTLWLLKVSKAARRDADVMDWWYAEPSGSGYPVLSDDDKNSMGEFAGRLLQCKPAEGDVPWDIQLHVTEGESQLANYGEEWFRLLEDELRSALMVRGVHEDSELLRFDFDHIAHQANRSKNIVRSVGIFVYDTAGQTIQKYQNAQSIELLYVPLRGDLVASSRRKLHWRVEALARIVDGVESDRSLLVLALNTAENLREARTASTLEEVKAAARKAYRESSDEKTETFIKKQTAFMHANEKRGQGLFVDLIERSTDAPALRNASGFVAEQYVDGSGLREARKEWQSWVTKARKRARSGREESVGAAGADVLFELPRAGRARLRGGADADPARRDARVVARWHAEPPASGVPALSREGKARLGALAARLLGEFAPAEGGVPWDIQLRVTETDVRLKKYGRKWFDLLEGELKEALKSRGVSEGSDLLRFDFDHIRQPAKKSRNIVPGVDVFVLDIAGQTILEYRYARSLDLSFLAFRKDLMASSRRKLHWRVEALAKMVDGVESDQSLLVLDLRSSANLLEGQVRSVTRAVNAAVRTAYREKSDAEIEAFIKKHIELISGTSKHGSVLFVDIVQFAADSASAVPQTATEIAQLDVAEWSNDWVDGSYSGDLNFGPDEVGYFGALGFFSPVVGGVDLNDVEFVPPSPGGRVVGAPFLSSPVDEAPGVLQAGWLPDADEPEGWVARYFEGPVLPSSGVPAVLLSEVVVGGVDVGDVECVVLRRGSGVVGAL